MRTSFFVCLKNQSTKKIQFFNKFYCATPYSLCCALRYAVLSRVVNFVVQFYLRKRENKFHIVIYSKEHFLIIYIFEFLHSLVFIFRQVYSTVNGMLILIRLRKV